MASRCGRGAGGAPARHADPRRRTVRQGARRGASSCAVPRAEYAACLDAVKRLAMARSDVGFTLDHDGRRDPDAPAGRCADARRRAAQPRARPARHRHRLRARRPAAHRRDQPADLQPRHGRPAISVRQFAAGEGPPAGRCAARRLPRPDRPRPPPDRRTCSSRSRSRRSTSTSIRPRPKFGSAIRAAVRGLIVGGLRHALDEESQRSAAREQAAAPVMWTTQRRAIAPRTCEPRSAASPRRCARSSGRSSRSPSSRTRRAEPAVEAGAELSRWASPAARSPPPTSSPRPRTGWSSSTSTPRMSGWCSNGCARRARTGRSRGQALLIPEVVELDEPDCDRLEGARRRTCARWASTWSASARARCSSARCPRRSARPTSPASLADLAAEIAELGGPLSLRDKLDHVAATIACHGSVRAGRRAVGRRDERAAARDGSHAALRPVQPRPPDLGEALSFRGREVVREKMTGRRLIRCPPHLSLFLP